MSALETNSTSLKSYYGHWRQFRYFIHLTSLSQGDEEDGTR